MNEVHIYTHNDKKVLANRLSEIKIQRCYKDIFKLLIKKNIKYMRNNNGIFFNVSALSDDILNIIDRILVFYENFQGQNYL